MPYKQIIIDYKKNHFPTQLKPVNNKILIFDILKKYKIFTPFTKFISKFENLDYFALKTLIRLEVGRKQKQLLRSCKKLNGLHWVVIGFFFSVSAYHIFSLKNWGPPSKNLRFGYVAGLHQSFPDTVALPITGYTLSDPSRILVSFNETSLVEGSNKQLDCLLAPGYDHENFIHYCQLPVPQLKSFLDQRNGLFLTYVLAFSGLYTYLILVCFRRTIMKFGTNFVLFQSDSGDLLEPELEALFEENCKQYSRGELKKQVTDLEFLEKKYWNQDFDTFIALTKLQSRNKFSIPFLASDSTKLAERFINAKHSNASKSSWLEKTLCLLLVGPPTSTEDQEILAKNIAIKGNLRFFELDCSAFSTFSVSTALYLLKIFFGKVRFSKPCVAYLKNMDSFCQKRDNLFSTKGKGNRLIQQKGKFGEKESVQFQLLTQFLVNFDGALQRNKGVLFIASTNNLEALDPALTRSERFAFQYKFSPLTKLERQEFILKGLKQAGIPSLDIELKSPNSAAFDLLCTATEGYYRTDLKYVINNLLLQYSYNKKLDFSLSKNLFHKSIYQDIETTLMPTGKKNLINPEYEFILFSYIQAGQLLIDQFLQITTRNKYFIQNLGDTKWFKFLLLLINKIVIEDLYFSFSRKLLSLKSRQYTLKLIDKVLYKLSKYDERSNFVSFFSSVTTAYAPFISDTKDLMSVMPEYENTEDFIKLFSENFATESSRKNLSYEEVYASVYLDDKASLSNNNLLAYEEKISFIQFFTYNFLNSFLCKNIIFDYLASCFQFQKQVFAFDLYKLFLKKKLKAQAPSLDF